MATSPEASPRGITSTPTSSPVAISSEFLAMAGIMAIWGRFWMCVPAGFIPSLRKTAGTRWSSSPSARFFRREDSQAASRNLGFDQFRQQDERFLPADSWRTILLNSVANFPRLSDAQSAITGSSEVDSFRRGDDAFEGTSDILQSRMLRLPLGNLNAAKEHLK